MASCRTRGPAAESPRPPSPYRTPYGLAALAAFVVQVLTLAAAFRALGVEHVDQAADLAAIAITAGLVLPMLVRLTVIHYARRYARGGGRHV